MKKIIGSILLMFVLLGSFQCYRNDEFHHVEIPFFNNSDQDVYIVRSFNYPDTTDCDYYSMYHGSSLIKRGEKNYEALFMNTYWEDFFSRVGDTLMIFVLDPNSVIAHKEPQETVLGRYDVSLEDLERNNWMLCYPPNENMKSIKMWPPYSSYIK